MQDLYNTVKGRALEVAEYLTPVLKESMFIETGVLTPSEFLAAGEHLVHQCPTWRWETADLGFAREYLPTDKQYLVTRNVPCYKRVLQFTKDCNNTEERLVAGGSEGDEDWVATEDANTQQAVTDMEAPMEKMMLKETTAADSDSDGEAFDMEDFMDSGKLEDDFDPSEYISTGAADSAPSACDGETLSPDILRTRTYDLHISYDKFYQTPRLWLTGYSENRVPLSVDEMYEDFSQDHANKTITVERHPHIDNNIPMASVHPCKHAETMVKICGHVRGNGGEMQVHMYLIIFLKFMQSIIPTIEYDFTKNVNLNA